MASYELFGGEKGRVGGAKNANKGGLINPLRTPQTSSFGAKSSAPPPPPQSLGGHPPTGG